MIIIYFVFTHICENSIARCSGRGEFRGNLNVVIWNKYWTTKFRDFFQQLICLRNEQSEIRCYRLHSCIYGNWQQPFSRGLNLIVHVIYFHRPCWRGPGHNSESRKRCGHWKLTEDLWRSVAEQNLWAQSTHQNKRPFISCCANSRCKYGRLLICDNYSKITQSTPNIFVRGIALLPAYYT